MYNTFNRHWISFSEFCVKYYNAVYLGNRIYFSNPEHSQETACDKYEEFLDTREPLSKYIAKTSIYCNQLLTV